MSIESTNVPTTRAKRQFIIYAKQIDKFNTKRCRVELTPAVCDICGFDLGGHNNLGKWDEMEPETQGAVKKALAKHKQEFHTRADSLIVDEDQLPKSYLGGSKPVKLGR